MSKFHKNVPVVSVQTREGFKCVIKLVYVADVVAISYPGYGGLCINREDPTKLRQLLVKVAKQQEGIA